MRKFLSSLIWAPIFYFLTFGFLLLFPMIIAKVYPEKITAIENTKSSNASFFDIYVYFLGEPFSFALLSLCFLAPILAIVLCVLGKLPYSKKKLAEPNAEGD